MTTKGVKNVDGNLMTKSNVDSLMPAGQTKLCTIYVSLCKQSTEVRSSKARDQLMSQINSPVTGLYGV
jgi:hypothetical protein